MVLRVWDYFLTRFCFVFAHEIQVTTRISVITFINLKSIHETKTYTLCKKYSRVHLIILFFACEGFFFDNGLLLLKKVLSSNTPGLCIIICT
jgi:hypothetical protein